MAMEKKKTMIMACLALFIVALGIIGCGAVSTTEATPEQLYSGNHSIDMFVYEDTAYVNAADVDWVKNETFERGKYIGKISNSETTNDFKNWDATVLPVGTEVYESGNTEILLVRLEEKFVPYLKYVEG